MWKVSWIEIADVLLLRMEIVYAAKTAFGQKDSWLAAEGL
jgi:hypothetical protein